MIFIENLSKSYGSRLVLDQVNLNVEENKRTVIFGPSGSGKSTLLRLIAGLEKPERGLITGTDSKITMVFQEDFLFGHLTTYENIAYGLDRRFFSKGEIESRVKWIAQITHTSKYLERKVDQLSGGERQRVAIARALVSKPNVILLDEAFNHLDPRLKKELLLDLIEWQKTLAMTMICVSHDFEEAEFLGEKMVILDQGHILQIGTPQEIYNHPNSIFIANLLDLVGMNKIVLEGKIGGIRPKDCFFEKGTNRLFYGKLSEKTKIALEDGILWNGKINGSPFSVFQKKTEASFDSSVYIDVTKIVSF